MIGSTTIKDEEEAETIGVKRKRCETTKSYEKKSRANEEKQFELGYRVVTPYGIGVVVGITKNKYDYQGGDTIKVRLKWGDGYFQPKSLMITDTFRFLQGLSFENVQQIIAQANRLDPIGDTKIGNMLKTIKLLNQNKFLYNIAVLLIKKGISQSNIAKALSVSPGNISSWMLGTIHINTTFHQLLILLSL